MALSAKKILSRIRSASNYGVQKKLKKKRFDFIHENQHLISHKVGNFCSVFVLFIRFFVPLVFEMFGGGIPRMGSPWPNGYGI